MVLLRKLPSSLTSGWVCTSFFYFQIKDVAGMGWYDYSGRICTRAGAAHSHYPGSRELALHPGP